MTLTLILVDDSNNAAQFNRMQVCLSGVFQCEKDYQSIIVKMKEEQDPENNSFSMKFAKMNDVDKNDEDICYYLTGIFSLIFLNSFC